MSQVFRTKRRVQFCETDMAGIAHFSAFMCYMEQVEHEFLRHLGTSVVNDIGNGWHISWPRVHVECDYQGAVRFEDELDVVLKLSKLGSKSVTYEFGFELADRAIANGKVVAVCCKVHAAHGIESIAIPQELSSKLAPYCA